MKFIGIILIAGGLSLLVYVGYFFVKERGRVISPIPEEKGIKVIFITPSGK